MKDQPILRIVTKMIIPYLLVYGLYVITHGELGPGGGFQGGVVIGAAFILLGLVRGAPEMRAFLPRRITDAAACLGVGIYAGVGVFCMATGRRFLDYTALKPSDPGSGEAWGMTLVEYGVGLTVASVMVTIYNEMTEGNPSPAAGLRD